MRLNQANKPNPNPDEIENEMKMMPPRVAHGGGGAEGGCSKTPECAARLSDLKSSPTPILGVYPFCIGAAGYRLGSPTPQSYTRGVTGWGRPDEL